MTNCCNGGLTSPAKRHSNKVEHEPTMPPRVPRRFRHIMLARAFGGRASTLCLPGGALRAVEFERLLSAARSAAEGIALESYAWRGRFELVQARRTIALNEVAALRTAEARLDLTAQLTLLESMVDAQEECGTITAVQAHGIKARIESFVFDTRLPSRPRPTESFRRFFATTLDQLCAETMREVREVNRRLREDRIGRKIDRLLRALCRQLARRLTSSL
jgi:hypothetical protein